MIIDAIIERLDRQRALGGTGAAPRPKSSTDKPT